MVKKKSIFLKLGPRQDAHSLQLYSTLYIYPTSQQQNIKWPDFLKWAEDLDRYIYKDSTQIANKCLRRWSASLSIREMQIKCTPKQHLTHFWMAPVGASLWGTERKQQAFSRIGRN